MEKTTTAKKCNSKELKQQQHRKNGSSRSISRMTSWNNTKNRSPLLFYNTSMSVLRSIFHHQSESFDLLALFPSALVIFFGLKILSPSFDCFRALLSPS